VHSAFFLGSERRPPFGSEKKCGMHISVKCVVIEIAVCIGYFEATRGRTTCDLFTEARSAEVNKHISPRCLKITYLFFTLRGRVNESE
jgi:hypothetical protein